MLGAMLAGCLTAAQSRLWITCGTRYRRPSLSPDGRWLLFEADQRVHVCRPDGTGETRLLADTIQWQRQLSPR